MKVKGFICEVFSSYQGEGGTVPGSCAGKRQIFVRFAGCNLASGEMGTKGCIFCDSPRAKVKEPDAGRIEIGPGTRKFERLGNPVEPNIVVEAVKELVTPDLHSVSLTGGEPLWQPDFLKLLATKLRSDGMRTYLETNGSLPSNLSGVVGQLDFACVDIKDESADAASSWTELLGREFRSIEILKRAGVLTFSKVVVSNDTKPESIELISKRLAQIGCPLAIQAVTPLGFVKSPSKDLLFALTEAAAKHLHPDAITISIQTHRAMNLL